MQKHIMLIFSLIITTAFAGESVKKYSSCMSTDIEWEIISKVDDYKEYRSILAENPFKFDETTKQVPVTNTYNSFFRIDPVQHTIVWAEYDDMIPSRGHYPVQQFPYGNETPTCAVCPKVSSVLSPLMTYDGDQNQVWIGTKQGKLFRFTYIKERNQYTKAVLPTKANKIINIYLEKNGKIASLGKKNNSTIVEIFQDLKKVGGFSSNKKFKDIQGIIHSCIVLSGKNKKQTLYDLNSGKEIINPTNKKLSFKEWLAILPLYKLFKAKQTASFFKPFQPKKTISSKKEYKDRVGEFVFTWAQANNLIECNDVS